MSRKSKLLSRRDFLKLSGVTSLGLVVSGCSLTQILSTPTLTSIPSTNTKAPTETSTPTRSPKPTHTSTSTSTPLPPPPDLSQLKPNYFWKPRITPHDLHIENFAPDMWEINIIDDPTRTFEKVVRTRIFAPNPEDVNHRVYPSNDSKFNIFTKNYEGAMVRGLPISMQVTINLQEVGPKIGRELFHQINLNDRKLKLRGYLVGALAGDMLIYPPSGDWRDPFRAGMENNIFQTEDGKVYIIPMSCDNFLPDLPFYLGHLIDPDSYLTRNKWYDLQSIVTDDGIWTMSRPVGEGEYRVMGWVRNYQPGLGAASGHFGPYALHRVGEKNAQFDALQTNYLVETYGPTSIGCTICP